ncbi:MAG: alpha/beta hydrolase [Ferruginibacter sp.]|nr:alpha/beta hydrolase [Ferruginibacter sp.]
MQTIYVFSGLGADERVFYKIDFGNYNVVFIEWITPHKNETIESYALRLIVQINTVNPILIGLSFGGMMAVEVAKHISTEKIILISSAKNKNEIPYYFRVAGTLGLHKIIAPALLVKVNIFTNWFFSSRTVEDKKMLSAILHDTNPVFLKWAIAKIVTWKNTTIHQNLQQLHGTADRILPYKKVMVAAKIEGGAHLMVVSNAEEVSAMLRKMIY